MGGGRLFCKKLLRLFIKEKVLGLCKIKLLVCLCRHGIPDQACCGGESDG